MNEPVDRVDSDTMVLDDNLRALGGCVGCGSDDEVGRFLVFKVGRSVGGGPDRHIECGVVVMTRELNANSIGTMTFLFDQEIVTKYVP